jgi:hypothetical protein
MPEDRMTPRERWLDVVQCRRPDPVPLHYRAAEKADAKLLAHPGCRSTEELLRRLHIDQFAGVGPAENVVAMYETAYQEGWT